MRNIYKIAVLAVMLASQPVFADETTGTSTDSSPIIVSQGIIELPTTIPQPQPMSLDAD